ncbi:hypothetical protein M407DRAFT_243126 [Tulasnella calospora MUT 4182]|uniref:Uncharacterized protein n=1 Tax=Tulasnella calospora MUT 4182 TaxID=1051891 RepID=A0A0C3L340_9AGAM|nr:hypothetical protein M407DRAFT_243126 [Tulasnella calospora MUT 4182]
MTDLGEAVENIPNQSMSLDDMRHIPPCSFYFPCSSASYIMVLCFYIAPALMYFDPIPHLTSFVLDT